MYDNFLGFMTIRTVQADDKVKFGGRGLKSHIETGFLKISILPCT